MLYFELLLVLVPLCLGYLIAVKNHKITKLVNLMLNWIIFIILFFMGINLAFYDNLSANLQKIGFYSLTFIICILICNTVALYLYEYRRPWRLHNPNFIKPSRLKLVISSIQLCGVVVAGFLVGLTHWEWLRKSQDGSQIALIVLLFLVGILLRNSGMTLKQITLNKKGLAIATVITISALIGGIIASLILDIPIKAGLSIASGLGWYSLSSIIVNNAFGPVLGSTAFFNDLVRELVAIMLVPTLANRYPSISIGLCGSTSMDFTLPVLQQGGGIQIVPAAIVNGFVLSLLAPLLMAICVSL